MFQYSIYNQKNKNDFAISAGCLDVFENIKFLHSSSNIDVGVSYSKYCFPQKSAFMQIEYIHKNEVTYTINDKDYLLKEGDCVIMGRGCTSHQNAGPCGCVVYSISVNPLFCKKYNLCDDINCHIKNDDIMKQLFLTLISKYDEDPQSEKTLTLMLQMLIHINHNYKQYSANLDETETFTDRQMETIIKYINRNIFNKIRLNDMAALLGMHPTYFGYVFKRTCGYSPITYANFLRCLNAREILLTTDFSPKEVIEACGFYSMSHFKKMYKNLIGRDVLADAATPPVVIKFDKQ